MKAHTFSILLISIAFLTGGCTMFNRMQGDIHYQNMQWSDAAVYYKRVYDKKEDLLILPYLADCYYKMGAIQEAAWAYGLAQHSPFFTDEDRFQYAEVLMAAQKYAAAREQYERYNRAHPRDSKSANRIAACDSIGNFRESLDYTTVKKMKSPLNNESSNFSPAWYEGGIVFTSERNDGGSKKISAWNGKPYMDLYMTALNQDSTWQQPQSLEGNINGIYHEGPMVFTADMQTVYFTRNNYVKRKRGRSDAWVNNLKIYSATHSEGGWTNITALPFNSDDYSCGHPALSADEETIYFVSDKSGGEGGTDIYASHKTDGAFTEIVSLKGAVNTAGNEMFPWVDGNNTLYFSSDGHPGIGGLDIFSAVDVPHNSWQQPVNMKSPINSSRDDFGFIMSRDGKNGFFSSNRDRINGVDDIYAFWKNEIVFALEGIVVEKNTQQPLRNALVELRNENGIGYAVMKTDADGQFHFILDPGGAYNVHGSLTDYFSSSTKYVSTSGLRKSETFFVKIELNKMEIGKPIVLKNIFYDFDKWNIRPDAEPELDNLVQILQDNPEIYIELSSHTDCRGKATYNQKLSQKRAESAVNYIIAKGIPAEKITAKGYGESVLVNGCRDGVKCPEDAHQLNRRTEFKVIKKVVIEELGSGM